MRDDVWVRYKREHGPLLHGPLTSAKNPKDAPMTTPSPIARRDFLRLTGIAAGSLAVAPAFAAAEGIERGAPQPHGSPGNGCQRLPVVPFSPERLGGAFHQLHFRCRGGVHGPHRAQACPPVRRPASDHEPDLGRDHRGARQATGSRHRAVPPRRTAGRGRHPQRRPPCGTRPEVAGGVRPLLGLAGRAAFPLRPRA